MNRNSTRRRRRQQEAAVCFPVGKLCGWLFILLVGVMVVYRLSEAAGQSIETACVSSIVVSFLAVAAGMIPIYKVWGKALIWVALGVFLSGVIRLLIGILGVIIIILFTEIQRVRFVGYLSLFYVAFMAVELWLALWVLRNTKIEKKEDDETSVIHGNIWDIVSRNRRSA